MQEVLSVDLVKKAKKFALSYSSNTQLSVYALIAAAFLDIGDRDIVFGQKMSVN